MLAVCKTSALPAIIYVTPPFLILKDTSLPTSEETVEAFLERQAWKEGALGVVYH